MEEKLLNLLDKSKKALSLIEINDLLNLKSVNELKKLEKELNKLVKTHKVFNTKKDKFILYKYLSDVVVGKITINRQGSGFILQETDDLYVNYKNLNGAINEDIVLAEIVYYKGKKEGKIKKVLERKTNNLIGTIIYKENDVIFKLDDIKKNISVYLEKSSIKNCVDGSKVLVDLVKDYGNNKYSGRVIKIIGHKNDPLVDIKTVAYKYNFFDEFSKETKNEINSLPNNVNKEDLINRVDLTNKVIFTIDGEDTKDIDDALSLEFDGSLYKLGVHIADVSYYVIENSNIDKDAYKRGTSSYLANSVIPMLPHKLSNGICSLNENELRLTISCEMEIDKSGNLVSYDIFPSYIRSNKKMTYKNVNDILMRNRVPKDYEKYRETLNNMNDLAHILRANKIKRGYIDFNIDEPKLIINEGKCIDVKRVIREDGEKLIEDFMIMANETVANHFYNLNLPFIYRVHDKPKVDNIDNFIKVVSLMGYKLIGKYDNLKPHSMQRILSQLEDKEEFSVLSSLLLRSMKKAIYSSDNIGHFGLGSKCYTHFTSPIRRYPDLMVHRLIKEFHFNTNLNKIKYYEQQLPKIAEHSSTREQESVEAEREVVDMKTAEYMEDKIGNTYEGVISGVTMFGMFVQLDNLVEGLIHVNTLKGDYFVYKPELVSLIGEKTKKRYRLGDKVKIKVTSASKETKTIDFELIGG